MLPARVAVSILSIRGSFLFDTLDLSRAGAPLFIEKSLPDKRNEN
jgi:hypothetical protein